MVRVYQWQTGPKAIEFLHGLADMKSMQFCRSTDEKRRLDGRVGPVRSALLVVLSLAFGPDGALAQMDPSSALLLSQPNQVAPRPTPVERRGEAGRYQVRPTPSGGTRRNESATSTNPSAGTTDTVNRGASLKSEAAPSSTQDPRGNSESSSKPNSEMTSTDDKSVASPAVAEPVGAASSSAEQFPRTLGRVLEMSFSPGFFYLDSKSDSAFRNFQSASPAIQLEAAVWLSDETAVVLEMGTSLAASVNDGTHRQVALNRNELHVGLQRRRVLQGGELIYGLGFFENQVRVSADAQRRVRLRTSGVHLNLEGRFNMGNGFWGLGVDFSPKASHAEEATSIQLKSGGAVDSHVVGLSLQRTWNLDPSSSVFLKLTHSVERDLFSGDSSLPDPVAGATLTNVGVTQSTTLIQFGVGWSN